MKIRILEIALVAASFALPAAAQAGVGDAVDEIVRAARGSVCASPVRAAELFAHAFDQPATAIPCTARVSVATDGTQGNSASADPSISADGRNVGFDAFASNLVPDDLDSTLHLDAFVHDLREARTVRVSVDSNGMGSVEDFLGGGIEPVLSADGRFVVFTSIDPALVADDTNNDFDALLHDRDADGNGVFDEPGGILTTLVARNDDGEQGNEANAATSAAISDDGRFAAFDSFSTNLVPEEMGTDGDVFVRDLTMGTTSLASRAADGTPGDRSSFDPLISADGRYVAFESDARNLVAGDTNGAEDVFVHDRQTGAIMRASLGAGDTEPNAESSLSGLSADGRFVVFSTEATNVVPADADTDRDVYVRDLQSGTTEIVSVASDGTKGDGASFGSDVSANGRFVLFLSNATNLVEGDGNGASDVFVRDRVTGTTERVNVATAGTEADGASLRAAMSDDGRFVAFQSIATNLVPGDTNASSDVFLRDRGLPFAP